MAKARSLFTCQTCGAVSQRWVGRCESCGEWNSIIEENTGSGIGAQAAMGAGDVLVVETPGGGGWGPPEPPGRARRPVGL